MENFAGDTIMLQRGSFRNGYQCYVYCEVQKDGKEVRIDSTDGGGDIYVWKKDISGERKTVKEIRKITEDYKN